MIQRYDCTNGGTQWCQGCYTMTPDNNGNYVRFDDHEAELAALRAELEAEKVRAEYAWRNAKVIDAERQRQYEELKKVEAERDALKAEQTEWRRKMSAALYEAEPARATLAQEVER